ncbi:hypothetical protein I4U23_022536 [Adineta vaga]|nr:hypothetical protein I4U23_022536 [Adineta vaga]
MKDQNSIILTNNILYYYLPLVPLDALALSLRAYISSTEKILPTLIINLIANIINIIFHYRFLFYTQMNIYTAPISISLAYLSIVIGAISYIRMSSLYKEAWYPITHACLQEWNIYIKLALPGVVSSIITTWSFELGNIFAASLSPRSLSAQAIVVQIICFLSLNMMAIGEAGNILIGQNLGANRSTKVLVLMFKVRMGIYGFWLGMIITQGLICTTLFIFIWSFDFDILSKIALDHISFDTSQNSLTCENISIDQSTDEHFQLLSFEQIEEQEHIVISINNQTLFKLLWKKIIVLFLFIFIFALSIYLSLR